MKKTRFSETKVVSILKRQEAGIPTAELCREHGISQVTFTIGKQSMADWKLGK